MQWEGGYAGWTMIDGWMMEHVYRAARKGKQCIDEALARITQSTGLGSMIHRPS
ncbi:MAG TPA: hypothetical protein PKO23_19560 [Candidatus Hydrogenedentes bacterium]|nr:hypothetical protein [Candidatus Hydrogenedentota bacterium]